MPRTSRCTTSGVSCTQLQIALCSCLHLLPTSHCHKYRALQRAHIHSVPLLCRLRQERLQQRRMEDDQAELARICADEDQAAAAASARRHERAAQAAQARAANEARIAAKKAQAAVAAAEDRTLMQETLATLEKQEKTRQKALADFQARCCFIAIHCSLMLGYRAADGILCNLGPQSLHSSLLCGGQSISLRQSCRQWLSSGGRQQASRQ